MKAARERTLVIIVHLLEQNLGIPRSVVLFKTRPETIPQNKGTRLNLSDSDTSLKVDSLLFSRRFSCSLSLVSEPNAYAVSSCFEANL